MRVVFLLVLISFEISGSTPKIIEKIENQFQVELVLDTTFHDSWNSVSYERVQDTTRLNDYLELLFTEYSKYPKGYLRRVRVDKIIICTRLHFRNQRRAAIPDPYFNALYLATDSDYFHNYLIHVMHHELHHCAEFSLYGNMFYKWEKWLNLNKPDFKYGDGGAEAYKTENKNINWYALSHPLPGFVNLYSTTGQEEDRCEIVALIMTDEERNFLKKFLKNDKILKRKLKLILLQLNRVSSSKFAYLDTLFR